ncbi:MAG: hypothetical protein Q6K99_09900 [Thermostichales cyanobacterium BF4_bins_65]
MLSSNLKRLVPVMLLAPLLWGSPTWARPNRGTALLPSQGQQLLWEQESARRASRDLSKAQGSLIRVRFLGERVSSREASALVDMGQNLLDQAQSQFQAGNLFAARETAKAADNLFKAAQILYESQLGYGSVSGRHWEAPLRAQEYLARAQAGNPSGTAATLVSQANQLLNRSQGDPTGLPYGRAARHTARAALHLLVAERGF